MAKEEKSAPEEEHAPKDEERDEEERDEDEEGDDGASDDESDDDGDGEAEPEKKADAKKADDKKADDKVAATKKAPAKKADEEEDEEEERKPAKASRPARPRPVRAAPPPPPPATNLGARVVVFIAVLLVLSSGFWLLSGFDSGLDKPTIKWRVGQQVEMDITLVKEDAVELGCASSQDIGGKKCEYGTKTDKNEGLTDAKMLKPYTTADGVNFAAAGLWSQPALDKAKLPNDRFTVHCKYKVEGMLKTPLVRWKQSAAWGEKKEDWYAGSVSDCKLNPP